MSSGVAYMGDSTSFPNTPTETEMFKLGIDQSCLGEQTLLRGYPHYHVLEFRGKSQEQENHASSEVRPRVN